MKTVFAMTLLLTVVGGLVVMSATEKKSGVRAKYYRKASRPNKNATRGPKHKDQDYDQHGWN
jgi:hypothetical protein